MSICHEAEKFLGESQTESIVALGWGKNSEIPKTILVRGRSRPGT